MADIASDAITWATGQFEGLAQTISEFTLATWFIPFIVALLAAHKRAYFKGIVTTGIIMWLGFMTLEQAATTIALILVAALAREGMAALFSGDIPRATVPPIDRRALERARQIYDTALRRGKSD